MNKKITTLCLMLAGLFVLTGCDVTMNNLTMDQVPSNPSNIYSMEVEARPRTIDIEPSSFQPYIVIDGQTYAMQKAGKGPHVFKYDYQMPVGTNSARYYYVVEYRLKGRDLAATKRIQSQLYDFELVNRYVSSMQSNRGLVGSEIPVLGRGFTEFDTISMGDVETQTRFVSANEIHFIVPPLSGNKDYDVFLNSGFGSKRIGEFRVDASRIRANKARVDLKSQQRTMLVFQLDNEAPAGGLELDITTNVPESVIMSDVTVEAGTKTVSAVIQGGAPGTGKLFVAAPGYDELEIAVAIQPDDLWADNDGFNS